MGTFDLRAYVKACGHPVLCVGPTSRNCVEAAVRLANRSRKPIPLIASRRQIEAAELGGGYVENWTTGEFAAFVRSVGAGGTGGADGSEYSPLCRDHGGPWQGSGEEGLDTRAAMDRAKASIAEDIAAGFSVIHLDPSIGEEKRTRQETLDLLFELYTFTVETAARLGRPIELEIGAEQQSGEVAGAEELIAFLKAVTRFCRDEKLPHPLFCVVQTGTLVRETRNIGLTEGRRNEEFDQKYAVATVEKNVRTLVDLAYINGVFVKEHNGDYLSDGSMASRAEWEIGGVNVAPEMGVFETRTLISLCGELGLRRQRDGLLGLFYESGKWKKWLRTGSTATDFQKAIIAGHYTFATPEFRELKAELSHAASGAGFDVDETIRVGLTGLLRRMSWCLGYHRADEHGTAWTAEAAPQVRIGRRLAGEAA